MYWKFTANERSLLTFAVVFRSVLFLVAPLIDAAFNDNDHSTDLFLAGHASPDGILRRFVRPWIRWDAVYFVEIAKNGYHSQKMHAFFPGLPLLMKLFNISRIQTLLEGNALSPRECLALTGLLINFTCHIINVFLLLRLSQAFLSQANARKAAILYSFNPASVHLSALYTETAFQTFLFTGLNIFYFQRIKNRLEGKPKEEVKELPSIPRLLVGSFVTSLAVAVRSNGLILIIFPAYLIFRRLLASLFHRPDLSLFRRVLKAIKLLFLSLIILILFLTPFFFLLNSAYLLYCDPLKNGRHYPEWCKNGRTAIYHHVEVYYWDVGFLKYIRFHNIFRIIIGAHMLSIVALFIFNYVKSRPLAFLSINLPEPFEKKHKNENGILSADVLPFAWLALVMFIVNALYAHIAISSRFQSTNPAVYWFIVEYLFSPDDEERRYAIELAKKSPKGTKSLFFTKLKFHWMRVYIVLFIITGMLSFLNFSPWV